MIKRIHLFDRATDLTYIDVQHTEDGTDVWKIVGVPVTVSPQQREYWLRHSVVNMERLKMGVRVDFSAGPESQVHTLRNAVKSIEVLNASTYKYNG